MGIAGQFSQATSDSILPFQPRSKDWVLAPMLGNALNKDTAIGKFFAGFFGEEDLYRVVSDKDAGWGGYLNIFEWSDPKTYQGQKTYKPEVGVNLVGSIGRPCEPEAIRGTVVHETIHYHQYNKADILLAQINNLGSLEVMVPDDAIMAVAVVAEAGDYLETMYAAWAAKKIDPTYQIDSTLKTEKFDKKIEECGGDIEEAMRRMAIDCLHEPWDAREPGVDFLNHYADFVLNKYENPAYLEVGDKVRWVRAEEKDLLEIGGVIGPSFFGDGQGGLHPCFKNLQLNERNQARLDALREKHIANKYVPTFSESLSQRNVSRAEYRKATVEGMQEQQQHEAAAVLVAA